MNQVSKGYLRGSTSVGAQRELEWETAARKGNLGCQLN